MKITNEGLTCGVRLVTDGTQGIGEAVAISHDLDQPLNQRGRRPVLCLPSIVNFSFGSTTEVSDGRENVRSWVKSRRNQGYNRHWPADAASPDLPVPGLHR